MEKISARLAPATWPDDIIEIIVGQVASSSIGADQPTTLKNCALVSKSFYFPARKRLCATIEFKINDSAQGRAARLCQILETNPAIIREIKSFRLILDSTSSVVAKAFSLGVTLERPKNKLLRVFWAENSLYRLLNWISHAELQKFTIYASPGPFDMSKMSVSSKSLFLAIRSIPSLRSLSVVGVTDIPVSLVVGSVGHDNLKHLLLCGSTLQKPSDAAIPRHDPSFNPLSKVEVLEWCSTLYSDLARILWPAIANSPSFEAPIPFPHLKRYTATLRSKAEANAMIWNVILGAAPDLEDLNIRDVATAGKYKSFIGLFSLDRLTALRRLTLSPHCSIVFNDCSLKLNNVVDLLSSGTVPTTVESLILDFHIKKRLGDQIDLAFKAAKSEWAALDSILTGPMFPNLRALFFRLNSIYYDSQIDISDTLLAKERKASRHLLDSAIPYLMIDSRISVDVDCTALYLDIHTRCLRHCDVSYL